jgi:hypothetical protein
MTLKARLGFDPLERLMAVGQVRASRHLARDADQGIAARAIAEELDRHAALVARLEETREAMGEIAGAVDEALTARLRAAAEADHEATVRPLAEVSDGEDAEHREFLTFLREVEAQQAARKPRRH